MRRVGHRNRYRITLQQLQRSTGHAPGGALTEVEDALQVPPSAQTDPVEGGPYLALVSGRSPVFSVEKPIRRHRWLIWSGVALLAALMVTMTVVDALSSAP